MLSVQSVPKTERMMRENSVCLPIDVNGIHMRDGTHPTYMWIHLLYKIDGKMLTPSARARAKASERDVHGHQIGFNTHTHEMSVCVCAASDSKRS